MIAGGRLKMPPKLLPAAIFQWRIRQTFFFFLIKMVKSPKYQAKQQQSLRGEVPVPPHLPQAGVLSPLRRSSTSTKSSSRFWQKTQCDHSGRPASMALFIIVSSSPFSFSFLFFVLDWFCRWSRAHICKLQPCEFYPRVSVGLISVKQDVLLTP